MFRERKRFLPPAPPLPRDSHHGRALGVGGEGGAEGRGRRIGALSFDEWAEDERLSGVRNVALYRDRWVGTRYSNESAAQQLNTWRGDGPERVAAELVDENPNGRVGAVVWSGGLIAVARGVAGFDLIAPACE